MVWFLIFIVLVLAYLVRIYNRLVFERNEVGNRLAQIDVVLTKRYDLIPNIVEVAKRYMQHERETFIKVTQARNQAMHALNEAVASPSVDALARLSKAEGALGGLLSGLQVAFEAYPDLKADAQLIKLQQDISDMEEQLAWARSSYNESVRRYNTFLQSFPHNLVAGFFYFRPSGWLEIEDEKKRDPVKVIF